MNSGSKKNAPRKSGKNPAGPAPRRSRRRGDIGGANENAFAWVLTFTDVMGLMLTFFVLLFSMTETSKQKWQEMTSAMQSEFNRHYGAAQNRGPVESISLNKIDFDQALDIPYLNVLLESVLSESKNLQNITLTRHRGELIVSLPQDLLFDPGSAEIKGDGSRALYELGETLARIQNKVEIMGHADPRPLDGGNGPYDSNWELSLARAAAVAGVLESVGYKKDVGIRGDSSGRYEDLKDIKDEQQRLDLARRVDIVLLNHDGSKKKVFFSIGDQ